MPCGNTVKRNEKMQQAGADGLAAACGLWYTPLHG